MENRQVEGQYRYSSTAKASGARKWQEVAEGMPHITQCCRHATGRRGSREGERITPATGSSTI